LKLLFDQNISPKILRKAFEKSVLVQHVRFVGLEDASDVEIFHFAKTNGYSIVTFDSDFFDLSLLMGFPPKIIWIRTGNLTTNSILLLLLKNSEQIFEFIELGNVGVLEIVSL
jgi:predicted nuclease of predicted toxin-antitoxin system